MSTLTGQAPKDTFKDLLQVSNANSGVDATVRDVEDGEGTTSALQLSTTTVRINGAFDGAAGATFDWGVKSFKLDTILESTAAAGVTIDSVLLKDGGITAGSDILSDTDSTDSLGSTGVRWLKLWVDDIGMGGTLTGAAVTLSGILSVDNTTDSTSTTTGSIHTDGGLGVAKKSNFGDTLEVTSGITSTINGIQTGSTNSQLMLLDYQNAGGSGGDTQAIFRLLNSGNSGRKLASFDDLVTINSVGDIVTQSTSDSTSTTTGSIQTDGGLGVAKTIVAGTGIKLGGTAAGNLLSDIQNITFTPTVLDASLSASESQTYTVQKGVAKKIGKVVYFSLRIEMLSLGSLTGTDALSVGGLPFTSTTAADVNYPVVVGNADSLSITSGTTLTGFVPVNSTIITIENWDFGGGTTSVSLNQLTASGKFSISGFYFVD